MIIYTFTGYAIIQLPELLLFLHKRLISIKWNRSFKRDSKNNVEPNSDADKLCADKNEKIEIKIRSVLARLSRVEQNDITMSKKLDKIMRAIDNLKY